jgi:hypothetical protein
MRRNRRSPGVSGSISFLSRALKQSEQEFTATLVEVGFIVPSGPNDRPAPLDIGNWSYWLNQDGRGGLWINGRKRSERDRGAPAATATAAPAAGVSAEAAPASPAAAEGGSPGSAPQAEPSTTAAVAPAEAAPAAVPASSPTAAAPVSGEALLTDLRSRLETKPRGGAAASVTDLAAALGRSEADLLAALAAAGVAAPSEDGGKSEPVDLADEHLWLEKGAKDGVLRLQAKAKAKRKTARSTEESPSAADDGASSRPARKSTKKSAKI